MSSSRKVLIGALLVTGLTTVAAGQNRSTDLTQWRGPNRDGAVVGFDVPASWPEHLTQKWRVEIGTGYATPLLVGNRVYMFSRQGEDEVMSALDASNGKVIWRTGYPVSFTMHSAAVKHGPGPKSTPTYADGKLFSIGMTGVVTAFDAASGKKLWQKPGSIPVPMFTSHAFSPIVDRGLVIFHVGGHMQGALTAFDVNTGDVKWSWNGDGPGYGSPIIATIAGVRQLVTITQGKMIGIDPSNGTLLWERPFVSANFTNSATPLLSGNTVIASNGGPTTGITVTRQDNQWKTETAWENNDIPFRFSNLVLVHDTIFGLTNKNSGQYFTADPKTGKTLWTSAPRQAGNAALLETGDLVFSLQDDGDLVVFRSGASGMEQIRRYKVADSETWTQPTIAGNRIFVKDVSNLMLWTLN